MTQHLERAAKNDSGTYRYARICRTYSGSGPNREPDLTSEWTQVDSSHLEHLRAVVDAGNELCGSGSHWLELKHFAEVDLK